MDRADLERGIIAYFDDHTPVVGHGGSALLVVNVQGRAAHASTPLLGVSAAAGCRTTTTGSSSAT
jgi:acetylornithine deacetylase/succinyl-diaminopimelate desuccinylase-like protein